MVGGKLFAEKLGTIAKIPTLSVWLLLHLGTLACLTPRILWHMCHQVRDRSSLGFQVPPWLFIFRLGYRFGGVRGQWLRWYPTWFRPPLCRVSPLMSTCGRGPVSRRIRLSWAAIAARFMHGGHGRGS
jgi:hypothetical protein